MDQVMSPLKVIKEAVAAVPAVRYALGISGIVAAIALISSLRVGARVAVFGTIVMLVLMALLVIFARLSTLPNKSIALPAIVFTWFSLLLVMATATALFTSVFFKQPADLQYWLRPAAVPASPSGLNSGDTGVVEAPPQIAALQETPSPISATSANAPPLASVPESESIIRVEVDRITVNRTCDKEDEAAHAELRWDIFIGTEAFDGGQTILAANTYRLTGIHADYGMDYSEAINVRVRMSEIDRGGDPTSTDEQVLTLDLGALRPNLPSRFELAMWPGPQRNECDVRVGVVLREV